jgi:hypothetical protein
MAYEHVMSRITWRLAAAQSDEPSQHLSKRQTLTTHEAKGGRVAAQVCHAEKAVGREALQTGVQLTLGIRRSMWSDAVGVDRAGRGGVRWR